MVPLDRHDQPLLTKEQDIARYPNKKKCINTKTKMDQIGRANKNYFYFKYVCCMLYILGMHCGLQLVIVIRCWGGE